MRPLLVLAGSAVGMGAMILAALMHVDDDLRHPFYQHLMLYRKLTCSCQVRSKVITQWLNSSLSLGIRCVC